MSSTTSGLRTRDRTTRRGRAPQRSHAPGPEDERLPLGRTTAYGFQHVLTTSATSGTWATSGT